MIKRAFRKRLFNLVIGLFVIGAVLISVYFYLSAKTKIDAVRTAVVVIRDSIDTGLASSLNSNLAGITALFVSQLIVFIVAVLCLSFGMWFLSSLYFVEKRNSLVDPLTGLYNKRAISFWLDKELKRSVRSQHPISVAVIDIDYFKIYNDTLGHVAGDRLLQRFAKILELSVRDYDVVGRIGGEEFLIIFPETSLKKATQVCERIRKSVQNTRFAGEPKLPHKQVTTSIGVAEFHGDRSINKEKIIGEADSYLYDAKQEGRNRVIAK